MKIYNSMTRRKEEFMPVHEGKVFVCFVHYPIPSA